MRLLTKREACRELRLSLSTLNRRIAAGEVPVRREPRGRRHRVYVMLDDGPPSAIATPQSELAVAQDRIHGLEEQVELLQGQLEMERQRNAVFLETLHLMLKPTTFRSSVQERTRPRWQFWKWVEG